LRRPHFEFQHSVWRRAGTLTRRGRAAAIGIALWLAFAVHTGVANTITTAALRDGAPIVARMMRDPASVPPAELERADAAFARAAAWNAISYPILFELRGLAQRALGRHTDAEALLRRAVQLDPDMQYAQMAIANYCWLRGERAEAARIANDVLARHPDNKTAKALLERLK
jgi:tetratricopeptide (TPR) repeat protein